MIEQQSNTLETESTTILERIAQSILIGYAWVSGPAMTEQQRVGKGVGQGPRPGNGTGKHQHRQLVRDR